MEVTMRLLPKVLVVGLLGLEAVAADWKYAGGASPQGGEQTLLYFDSESVERLTDGTVRAWTKSITVAEFNRMSKMKQGKMIEGLAKIVAGHYFPPYAVVSHASADDIADIVAWETVANLPETRPRAKVIVEIDCRKKMIRTLSATIFNDDESVRTSGKNGERDYISPEANGDTLRQLLCNPSLLKAIR
jgi:hypothetical protein